MTEELTIAEAACILGQRSDIGAFAQSQGWRVDPDNYPRIVSLWWYNTSIVLGDPVHQRYTSLDAWLKASGCRSAPLPSGPTPSAPAPSGLPKELLIYGGLAFFAFMLLRKK